MLQNEKKTTPLNVQSHIYTPNVVFLRLFTWLKVPLEVFLKWDNYFLKPTADSNLILWCLRIWSAKMYCCISWLNSQSFKLSFISSRLLQQKKMIMIESDIVTGDVLLWLRGVLYQSFRSIGKGHHLFCLFFREARQRRCRHPGRK